MIISILSALTTIGVIAALNSSKASSTETDLQTISAALSTYQVRWGDYPPSTLDELGTRAPNGINNGVESLVASLSSKKRGGILYQPPAEEMLTNVDGDSASKNVTDWYFGDNQLREFTDRFGYVIYYVHHRDYAKPKAAVTQVKVAKEVEEAKIEPEKSPATKAFVNPEKFQLRAVGRDGKPGTGDDLRPGN